MIRKALTVLLFAILLTLMSGPAPVKGEPQLASTPIGLGPEFQISDSIVVGADHYLPDVTYNFDHKEFLVVWHQNILGLRNIYAQRVSLEGGIIGSVIQVSYGDADAEPSVAYSVFNDDYLVVWMHDAFGNGSRYEIWGRLVNWDGSFVGNSFRIFTWPTSSFWTPKVAYGSDYPHNAFFVIWNAYDTTTGQPKDISGVHVSDAGVPDVAAHNIAYEGQSDSFGYIMHAPHEADLTYNNMIGDYLVTWIGYETWHNNPPTELNGVFGQFVYNDGKLFREWFCPGCFSSGNQTPATASAGNAGYLIVLSHQDPPAPHMTVGQMYDIHGAWVGSPFKQGEQLGNQINQAVAGNGSGAFVVARQVDFVQGQQIWAMQCHNRADGAHCDDSFPVENTTFWDGKNPAIANGGPAYTDYLIVYEESAPGDPSVHQKIFGRIYSSRQWVFLPLVRH